MVVFTSYVQKRQIASYITACSHLKVYILWVRPTFFSDAALQPCYMRSSLPFHWLPSVMLQMCSLQWRNLFLTPLPVWSNCVNHLAIEIGGFKHKQIHTGQAGRERNFTEGHGQEQAGNRMAVRTVQTNPHQVSRSGTDLAQIWG